jgi:hypothetical protein
LNIAVSELVVAVNDLGIDFRRTIVRPTVELTGLPPVSETIVVPNTFDEKLAGGNSGPTICWVAPP